MFNNYLYGKKRSYRKDNDYPPKPPGNNKFNNKLEEYIAKNWRPKDPDDREDLE